MPDSIGSTIVSNLPVIGGIASDVINAISQGAQNRKMRKFSREMYDRQRNDALADWKMQAEYNSPAAQMQRLKDAGLNPNLVYGHGADAQMGSPVRQSNYGSYNPKAIDTHFGEDMMKFYEIKTQRLNQNVLEQLATLREEQARTEKVKQLKLTNDAIATDVRAKYGTKMLEGFDDLRKTQLDVLRADTAKKLADTEFTLDENQRKAAMNSKNLQEATQRILNLEVERKQRQLEMTKIPFEINKLKEEITKLNIESQKVDQDFHIHELDRIMVERGLRPGDPAWWRALNKIMGFVFHNDEAPLDPHSRQRSNDSTNNPYLPPLK